MTEFSFTNSGTTYYDLTNEIGDEATVDGAKFLTEQPLSSSGTGLIQAFVRVQATGDEEGYNTTHRPVSYDENTSPSFTTSLLLSSVPIVTIGGQDYFEFRLDINQTNNNALLSLDELKVYKSATGDVTGAITPGGTFDAATTPVWDLDDYDLNGVDDHQNSLLLDYSLQAGSGKSDMFFYVPIGNFGVAADDYDTTYVVLYSAFGQTGTLSVADNPGTVGVDESQLSGDYSSNDGFEEWSVSKTLSGAPIYGYKWEDTNGNGAWDDGEQALSGWKFDFTLEYTIEGKGGDPDIVASYSASSTTDANGRYTIIVPAADSYKLTVAESGFDPTVWVNTYDGTNTVDGELEEYIFDASDLPHKQGNGTTADLVSGTSGDAVVMNFGNFEFMSISGYKWEDADADSGWDEADSAVLSGITIVLDDDQNYGNGVIAETTTNGDGYYSFNQVGPNGGGTLYVYEYLAPGSDYVKTYGGFSFTVESGKVIAGDVGDAETGNFGNFELFDISGHKYIDTNGDGDWDAGETTGVDGVRIYIDLNNSGTFNWTDSPGGNGVWDAGEGDRWTVTTAGGNWSFTGLGPSYIGLKVYEDLTYGDKDDTHYQTIGEEGLTISTTSGENVSGLDFGNVAYGSISGTKFEDANGDGQTAGDDGIEGWNIYLFDSNPGPNPVLATADFHTTTDADGNYSFTKLPIGTYWLIEESRSGWVNTTPVQIAVTGTGTSGFDIVDQDFANFDLFDISGHKYIDTNGDGDWDAGETTGVDGVRIYIDLNNSGTFNWTDSPGGNGVWDAGEGDRWTVTTAGGNWSFTGLGPSYIGLKVYEDLTYGDKDDTHYQTIGEEGLTISTTSGENVSGLDFGNVAYGSISGHKFIDKDGLASTDDDYTPYEGWTIYLYDGDPENGGTLVDQTTTGADGSYTFDKLPLGTYWIVEESKGGWVNVLPAVIAVAGTDTDTSGFVVTDQDFTNFEEISISGYKWNDINNDKQWTPGEGALASWTIVLDSDNIRDNDNTIATTSTNGSGHYSFTGIGPNDDQDGDGILYVYEVVTPGFTQTYGDFSFSMESGIDIVGTFGETEDGNFGNHMLGGYVRTPGFWQNKTWQDFWDGDVGVPKQAGETGFPSLQRGDLLIYGHTDGTGPTPKGLLIGDWNHDGITQVNGPDGNAATLEDNEDTIFISYANALTLIKADDSQASGNKGNATLVLGRDVVATWLNYLAGANIDGSAPADLTPKHFIGDAVDWLQQFASTAGDSDATSATLVLPSKIPASDPRWQKAQDGTDGQPDYGIDHSAAVIHAELDYYNNTGSTYDPDNPLLIYHFSLHP